MPDLVNTSYLPSEPNMPHQFLNGKLKAWKESPQPRTNDALRYALLIYKRATTEDLHSVQRLQLLSLVREGKPGYTSLHEKPGVRPEE